MVSRAEGVPGCMAPSSHKPACPSPFYPTVQPA
jgi:hypothetical protein